MEYSKALCPNCGAEETVEKDSPASVCSVCGKPYITADAIDAFFKRPDTSTTSENDPDMFPHFYDIHITRQATKIVGIAVKYLFNLDGDIVTLHNGGDFTIKSNRRTIEIPVLKTNGNDLHVEGVLVGIPDGNNIELGFKVKLGTKEIAEITYTSNKTLAFIKS